MPSPNQELLKKMPSPNQELLKEITAQPWCRELAIRLDELFRNDPAYRGRKLLRILKALARGERIARWGDRYVISSLCPPLPSRAFTTFLTGGSHPDALFSDLAYARRGSPASANLCITQRCFYHCDHCGATLPENADDLTTAQWVQVIHDLQDLGLAYISFSGGEPLLRNDLEEILRAADDRSVTQVFTNGRLLTRQRAQSLKEAGLFYLGVSLDSPDSEKHDDFRGAPQAFEHAIEAIHHARAAGLYTIVSSVIFRKDLSQDNLHRLFRLAREHGAHEVRVHQPIPRGRLAAPQEDAKIFWTRKDMAKLYRIQMAANRDPENFPKVSSFPYTEGPCKFGCGAGLLHSYISSTGDVWPCDFVPLSFGNVLAEPLQEVYKRMLNVAGHPATACRARKMAVRLNDRELPLSCEEALALFPQYQTQAYPRFFKTLQS